MGRIYYATSDIASFTSGDIIEIAAPSDAVVAIHSLHVGAQTEINDSSVLRLMRATGSGSGGGAITARPREVGDSAFGGTLEEANSTPASTLTELLRWRFSTLVGVDVIFTPETRPIISPSGILVLNMEDALTAVTLEWTLVFEEIGG
jgi:hypothetical protein